MRALMYVNTHTHTTSHGLLCHEILNWVSVGNIASRLRLEGFGEEKNPLPLTRFERRAVRPAQGPNQVSYSIITDVIFRGKAARSLN